MTLSATLVAVLLLVGCTSAQGVSPTPGDRAAPAGARPAVTVPDGFTPVVVTPIGNPTFPWLGSDRKYHVSYDPQLTNASRLPAALTKVRVVDVAHHDTVVANLSSRRLVDPDCE